MSVASYTSLGGSQATHQYEIGQIEWDEKKLTAFVIRRFPNEGGFQVRDLVVNRMLAEHPDLSADLWAVFAKASPKLPVPEWELLGMGHGFQSLVEEFSPSGDIPTDVIRQLEEILPT